MTVAITSISARAPNAKHVATVRSRFRAAILFVYDLGIRIRSWQAGRRNQQRFRASAKCIADGES